MEHRKGDFQHGKGETYHGLGSAASPSGGEGSVADTVPDEEQVAEAEKQQGKPGKPRPE